MNIGARDVNTGTRSDKFREWVIVYDKYLEELRRIVISFSGNYVSKERFNSIAFKHSSGYITEYA